MQRKLKGEKSFQELLEDHGKHEDTYCDNCKKNTTHTGTFFYSCTQSTCYVIIRLNLSIAKENKFIRYDMKIKNFDADKVEIPGMEEKFILKSAIIYEQLLPSMNIGHYTSLTRIQNRWFNISDADCFPALINNDLMNYYVLFLQRI